MGKFALCTSAMIVTHSPGLFYFESLETDTHIWLSSSV